MERLTAGTDRTRTTHPPTDGLSRQGCRPAGEAPSTDLKSEPGPPAPMTPGVVYYEQVRLPNGEWTMKPLFDFCWACFTEFDRKVGHECRRDGE